MRDGEAAEADLVAQVFLNAKVETGTSGARLWHLSRQNKYTPKLQQKLSPSANSSFVQIKKAGLMQIGQGFNKSQF